MPHDMVGASVGPYQVLAPLARGGMSMLHLVRDVRSGTCAVLKTLLPETFARDDLTLTRFRREVEILSRIESPHVVRVLGPVIEGPAGWSFPLELVQGTALEARLRSQGRLPPAETLALLRQMGAGLAAIHRAGVVHRDLKPANAMIESATLRLRIVDFGLALAEDLARITGTGHVVGTPRYMSPEQHHVRDLDPRSDLYSFGIVAYELLAGGGPFRQPGFLDLARAKELGTWSRLASARPELGAAWDPWLERALAPAREDRFASVDEALAALPRLEA